MNENINLLMKFLDGAKIILKTPEPWNMQRLRVMGAIVKDETGHSYDLTILIKNILEGKYKLYEEKPRLEWQKITRIRMGEYKFRSEYWATPCKTYAIVPAVDRFLLFNEMVLLEESISIYSLKDIAQQHFEESN